jgi:DNA-binding LytR/AlgR family response regulator
MIRVLVVDDEASARNRLLQFIKEEPEFEAAGTAANGAEALCRVKDLTVDVVFLDIDMPGMNGLEVAGCLAKWQDPPIVVFATAFDQYAVKAFEAHALDYILKPYDGSRLKEAFGRVKEQIRLKQSAKNKLAALEKELSARGTLKKIVGRKRNSKEKIMIDPEEVFYFHASNTEVMAALADKELIVNMTLEELLGVLDPTRFVQPHRSYIANLGQVEKVIPMFKENYELVMKDPKHTHIPLSRHQRQEVQKRLANW